MNNVIISIIIPVYNTGKYVEKCINSVINQTLRDIEIIIINDGSTDTSLEKIKRYGKDKRVKIINKKNEGVSIARNLGIKSAKGKYLYFIDSDDYLNSDVVLEELYNKSERENLDVLIFDYYHDYGDKKDYIQNFNFNKKNEISKENMIKDLLEDKYWGTFCNKLIKKDIFVKNNILFPENIFFREDLITMIKVFYFSENRGKINKAFYNYVQHEKQTIRNFDKKRILANDYNFIINLKDFFEKHNQLKKFNEYIEKLQIDLFCNVFRFKNRKLEIFKTLSRELKGKDLSWIYKSEYFKRKNLSKRTRFLFFSKILLK